jgi:hypothetical protein
MCVNECGKTGVQARRQTWLVKAQQRENRRQCREKERFEQSGEAENLGDFLAHDVDLAGRRPVA